MHATDRPDGLFPQQVRVAFGFLPDAGFAEVEALPTLMRYQRGDVEVDIYHGRRSFEVAAGVRVAGVGFAMSEIIRAVDPEAAGGYRHAAATSPEGVAAALEALAALMKRHGREALAGEPRFVAALVQQRTQWAEAYALEVLAAQLRPQAENAFRRGDYDLAAQLYDRFRDRLSLAEAKKLAFARNRCSREASARRAEDSQVVKPDDA